MSSTNAPKELPLKDLLEDMTQQIIRARVNYDIWWFLAGRDSRSKIQETLESYESFFVFAIHSHFVSLIIHCANVLESHNQSNSLPKLVRQYLANKNEPDTDSILNLFEKLEEDHGSIRKIRNNTIAHRSPKMTVSDCFRESALIPNQIRDILSDCLLLVNRLRTMNGLDEVEFNTYPIHDLRELFLKLGSPCFESLSTSQAIEPEIPDFMPLQGWLQRQHI